MYRSSVEYDGPASTDTAHVYYNANIINYRTSDLTSGVVVPDPAIRFNETRDAPIVKDASKYFFSIIRFTMNGPGLNLPLFIPDIQEGQSDPDLTSYSAAITYQQTWNTTAAGAVTFNIKPSPRFMRWLPQYLNATLAPVPRPPIQRQDIDSQYYWAYTYDHVIGLINATFQQAYLDTYTAFVAAWAAAATGDPFPYPTFADWLAEVNVPKLVQEPDKRFSIYYDSQGFGNRIEPFVPVSNPWIASFTYSTGNIVEYLGNYYISLVPANTNNLPTNPAFWAPSVFTPGPRSAPSLNLYLNSNMGNILANFPSFYENLTTNPGYVYRMRVPDDFYTNVVDYRVAPFAGVPPLGFVPVSEQKVYYRITQDFKSVSQLWSPISSLVFTTTMLPIKAEQIGAPVELGEGNLGYSSAGTAAAFNPIVTDIALNTEDIGADGYRGFIYYAPQAQYRLADLTPSQQAINNIDIQVFYKNRLNNQLYPVTIPNGGSVDIKVMFIRKDASDAYK
jgi:hypothetical protein